MKRVTICFAVLLLGCSDNTFRNDKPRFGSESGLPSNCRALVQANIDGYRARQFSADEVMASLERNCGALGQLWENQ